MTTELRIGDSVRIVPRTQRFIPVPPETVLTVRIIGVQDIAVENEKWMIWCAPEDLEKVER